MSVKNILPAKLTFKYNGVRNAFSDQTKAKTLFPPDCSSRNLVKILLYKK